MNDAFENALAEGIARAAEQAAKPKSFGERFVDTAASKPFVALAFAGIGFVIGVLSGVVF